MTDTDEHGEECSSEDCDHGNIMVDPSEFDEIVKVFPPGTWVFGIGKHKGCSDVFKDDYGNIQPFSYLNAKDPSLFRRATDEEIEKAKKEMEDAGIQYPY